jgi:hypothetical protein
MMMASTDQLIEAGDYNSQIALMTGDSGWKYYTPSALDLPEYMVIRLAGRALASEYMDHVKIIGSRIKASGMYLVVHVPEEIYRTALTLQYTTVNIRELITKY